MSEEQEKIEQEEPKSDRTSKVMGDMLKGLKQFGNAALEKAEEYGKIATEKAEELTKLGKLKLDIHQLNRSRSKYLEEVGELVLNLKAEDKLGDLAEHENFSVLLKSIAQVEKEIAEKEAEAAEESSKTDLEKTEEE